MEKIESDLTTIFGSLVTIAGVVTSTQKIFTMSLLS